MLCEFSGVFTRAIGNAEFGIDLGIIHRVIPILIHHFIRDISTYLPSVCTSRAKAPFSIPMHGSRLT